MHIRPLRESDIPVLKEMYAASGFVYDLPRFDMLEAASVVADENDKPLYIALAEKIVQLYLLGGDAELAPHAKLHAIRLLHSDLGKVLRKKGYAEANAFLPPVIAERFGKRLMKTFGWFKNWSSFGVRIP